MAHVNALEPVEVPLPFPRVEELVFLRQWLHGGNPAVSGPLPNVCAAHVQCGVCVLLARAVIHLAVTLFVSALNLGHAHVEQEREWRGHSEELRWKSRDTPERLW